MTDVKHTDFPGFIQALGGGDLQSDNMDAINRYIGSQEKPKTPEAVKLRSQWIIWHDALGWYERSFSPNIYDLARNKKNAYDLANMETKAEKEAHAKKLTTAFTTEETLGKPNRMLADGTYSAKQYDLVTNAMNVLGVGEEPFFPLRVKVAIGATVAGVIGLWLAKKVYLDPFIPRARASVKTSLASVGQSISK